MIITLVKTYLNLSFNIKIFWGCDGTVYIIISKIIAKA
jgi:hypothetical protein